MTDEVERLKQLLEEKTRLVEQRGREIEALNMRSMKILNERAQMIEELEGRNRGLNALLAAARDILQSLDSKQILSSALSHAMEALEVRCGWIQLLAEDGQELTLATQKGFAPELTAEIATVKTEQSPASKVIASGQPEAIEDISVITRDNLAILTKAGLYSFAAAPLKSKERVVGVIGVGAYTRRKFTSHEVELLSAIASQLSVALENATLYHQTKEWGERLAVISNLTRIINSSLDISEVYEGFVKELERVMDVDWAGLNLIDRPRNEVRFLALTTKVGSPWKIKQAVPFKGTATEWLAQNKCSVLETDLEQERKFWTDEFHLKQGLKSVVYLPLFAKGEVFGSMVVGSRRPHAYGKAELSLLEQIVGAVAMPIWNAVLYQESKARVEELEAAKRTSQGR